MKALLTSIYSALINGSPGSLVNGRIYYDRAPEEASLPYILFFVVSSAQDDPFAGTMERTYLQFSIFSSETGVTEIADIYKAVTDILDDSHLTLSAGEMVIMRRENLLTSVDETTTEGGTEYIKHWAIDYEVVRTRD